MSTQKITAPISDEVIKSLKAGDLISLSGVIYTGRDAAHKRMVDALKTGGDLPAVLKGQAVYYCGPCPAPPGRVIGSAGPTTSARMDAYSPILIQQGLKVMLGKGERSSAVTEAIVKYNGLYLAAVGGAGALLSLCVEKSEVVCYEDLGTEAIHRLTVRNMPLVVAIDSKGGNIYDRSHEKAL